MMYLFNVVIDIFVDVLIEGEIGIGKELVVCYLYD